MTTPAHNNQLNFKGLSVTRIQAQLLNKVKASSHRGLLCQDRNKTF